MPPRSAPLAAAAAAALLLALGAPAASAQTATGEIRGRVTDAATGAPVFSALVALSPTGSQTLTAQDGTFRLLRVPHGNQVVEVRALGFAPARARVRVEPGTPASVAVSLETAPIALDDVYVEAAGAPQHPRLAAFWRRRSRGGGVYFTREEIERRGAITLADLLRTVPNATIQWTDTGGSGTYLTFERTQSTCAAAVIVDGVPMQISLFGLDEIHPEAIEAIEVYSSGARVPPEYARPGAAMPPRELPQNAVANRGMPLTPTGGVHGPPPAPMGVDRSPDRTEIKGNTACGAVIIWTRMSVAPAAPEA